MSRIVDETVAVAFTAKELDALKYLSQFDELYSVTVSHFRDESDCGWLKVGIRRKRGGGNFARGNPFSYYKLSPLGHIYDFESGAIKMSYSDVLQESILNGI